MKALRAIPRMTNKVPFLAKKLGSGLKFALQIPTCPKRSVCLTVWLFVVGVVHEIVESRCLGHVFSRL